MKQVSSFGPLLRSRWLLLWVTACSAADQKVTFGPDDCVSLSRSTGGTCVLATNCEGKDTSAVEFSFICSDATGMEGKHTFGTGGFLDKETYDTEVECERCLKDPARKADVEQTRKAESSETAAASTEAEGTESVVSTADSRALLTKFAKSKPEEPAGVPPATASFYGPGGCVAVYKDGKAGSCWMQTRCQGQNISDYDFGMNCADADGQITKHMFGKNSFDPEETFNTLVTCEQCLALDQEPAKGVAELGVTVLSLEKELDAIKSDVKGIRDSLNPPAEAKKEDAADAEATDAEATDAEATDAASMVATSKDAKDTAQDADADTADLGGAEEAAEAAEAAEADEAADDAAEAAATDSAEDDDDGAESSSAFLRKTRKSMKKVRHHAPHHDPRPTMKKVHHRAHATTKKHVHHKKRVVDEDLDLDQPDMAEY